MEGIRKAVLQDIPQVAAIYDHILTEEEQGRAVVGWIRGVYPTEETALASLNAGTLFVLEREGVIDAAAKIDQNQVPEYAGAPWRTPPLGERAAERPLWPSTRSTPGPTAVPTSAWTPTPETPPPGGSMPGWAIGKRESSPVCLTEFPMCSWSAWRKTWTCKGKHEPPERAPGDFLCKDRFPGETKGPAGVI